MKSWAKTCWTSQIATQWTIWNDETIRSYKLYSASVPNTKYCQEVLLYFTLSNPGTWKITQSADPICLFPSAENSTVLPQSTIFLERFWYFVEILPKKWWPSPSSVQSQETAPWIVILLHSGHNPPFPPWSDMFLEETHPQGRVVTVVALWLGMKWPLRS